LSWKERVANKLPKLVVGEYWFVYDANIFIDDIGLSELGFVPDLLEIFGRSAQILDLSFLNEKLLNVFKPDDFDVFVFPGRGAQTVKGSLDLKGIDVRAKRIGLRNPRVELERFYCPQSENVVVVDDVVSSGVTAKEVFKQGDLNKASLAVWLMQDPRDNRLSCYQNVFAGFLVKGNKGRVAINSLSTFIEDSEIRKDFAQRYSRNFQGFVDFFETLEELEVSRVF